MIGDVGPSDIVFTIDHPYSIPFNNRVGEADPKQDPYGSHLVAKKGNLAALFASIGGITYIPETSALLPLIRSGVIGTDITTVPQAWGAVLMAGAAFYEVLIATAENREQEIRDIVGLTIRDQISLSSK